MKFSILLTGPLWSWYNPVVPLAIRQATIRKILMRINLITLIMIISMIQIRANVYSQKVTLNEVNTTMTKVLKSIETQTGYVFFYNDSEVPRSLMSIQVKDADIQSTLNKCFKNLPLSYKILGKNIVLRKVVADKKSMADIGVQKTVFINISGKIIDALGNPLPGVSIAVKGTKKGTTTGADGKYNIDAEPGETLVFSMVSFKTIERLVGDQDVINIVMEEENKALDEVVVVGFGTQKKASVIGAISTIKTKEIKQSPAANLSVTLAGRLPGLSSLQRSGEPGRGLSDLYIRGRSTVNVQRPLLLVDGVEREIDVLDPNEIEYVSILKDATATAIYGVRGANGVILVTTKRGEKGKTQINLSSELGLTNFTRFPNAVNAETYATLVNEANYNDLLNRGGDPSTFVPTYTDEAIAHYRNHDYPEVYPDHNWYKEFTRKFAPQNRFNLNVSGGSENVQYFINGGYLKQGGQYKTDQTEWNANTSLDRYNFRSNIDAALSKTLTATLSASGYLEKANRPSGLKGITNSAQTIINAMQVVPANAFNNTTPDGEVLAANSFPGGNPVYGAINRSGYNSEDRNQINASFTLNQKLNFITEGLAANVMFSFDSRGTNTQIRDRTYATYQLLVTKNPDGSDLLSYVPLKNVNSPLGNSQSTYFETHENLQASLTYNRSFNAKHNVSGLFLYNRDRRVIQIDLPYNLLGYVGRATYNYSQRYFGEFNFGYNGSEQFANGKRFGFFPSGSLGWLISEEQFVKNTMPFVNTLKLRGSYGIVGNDQFNAARFLYLDNYQSVGGGVIGGSLGGNMINEILVGNRDLTWETAKKLNIGLDLTLWDAFSVTFDVFKEKRDNILINRGTVPSVIGTSAFAPVNFGLIENKGFEIELSYSKQLNRNWNIYLKGNASYANNNYKFADEAVLAENYAYRYRQTRFPLGQPFGLATAGFFNSNDEVAAWADQSSLNNGRPASAGDLKYVDANGDGIIDNADYVPIGYPNVPLWNFGASFNITYKNFDFSVLIQGVGKVTQTIQGGAVDGTENFFDYHQNRYTAERYQNGEKITFPRLLYGSYINKQPSDFYTQRSDFLRLKNAEFGFTFPQSWSKKIGAAKTRFYTNGLNLFLIYDKTRFKQLDPETAQGGGALYPLTRVMNFGFNVVF